MASSSVTRLIAFVFILFGTYVASYLLFFATIFIPPGSLGVVSLIVALPSIFFFYRWAGVKRTIIVSLVIAGLVLLIESFGILSGLPYGQFFYSNLAGVKLFGLVPWSVALGFIPLLFGIMAIVTQYVQKSWVVILFSACLLVIVDLIIDPIFVFLGIWIWVTPGIYYGIPLSNFVGWFLTGLITSSVLWMLIKKLVGDSSKISIFVAISLILTLGFWSGYSLWSLLIIPYFLSLILLGFFVLTFIRCWSDV